MTPTDAVIGAEALLGRRLTDFEMKLVVTIVKKQLDQDTTWNQIYSLLDLKAADIVRRMISYRIASAGPDYGETARVLRDDTEMRMKRVEWD